MRTVNDLFVVIERGKTENEKYIHEEVTVADQT